MAEDLPNLHSIRIGTKALAYWPYRFIEGGDADDFLRLIGEVRAAGKHFALMAHSSHSRELEPRWPSMRSSGCLTPAR